MIYIITTNGLARYTERRDGTKQIAHYMLVYGGTT